MKQAYAAGRLGSETVPQNRPLARNIIYLMSGGMTHLDTFDPKPGTEQGGPVKAIKTKADGVQISEYLPLLAGQMDKGCATSAPSPQQRVHTSKVGTSCTRAMPRERPSYTPCMGAWTTRFQKADPTRPLPGSVVVGEVVASLREAAS